MLMLRDALSLVCGLPRIVLLSLRGDRGEGATPRFGLTFFRFLAAVVASFAVVNLAGAAASRRFSAAYILFHVPGAPGLADASLALLAVALGWSAFGPVRRRAVAGLLGGALGVLAALAGENAAEFYALVEKGQISTAWPVPLSLVLMVYIALHGWLCLVPRYRARGEAARSRPALSGAVAACVAVVAAVIFHVHALGLTDYRRPADAIVVLGAGVYDDGTPSEALCERVLTAVELYKEGLAPTLIMSGGTGPNGHSETRAMRELARRAGVPDEAIIEDGEGRNTAATARNVEEIARERGFRSVLAVSHYFHLPRIRLLFGRRGVPCFTVPADEGETLLLGTPYYVLRETAGLVWGYLRG
jgi:uncharacterized SAM-binding protein YcdF (DUF218 family)